MDTRFTQLVGCSVPMQQAPMAGVSPPDLVAAVADAGGVGTLSAMGVPADTVLRWVDGLLGRTHVEGDVEAMALHAGAGVGSATDVRPAAEVIAELMAALAGVPAEPGPVRRL